MSESVSLNNNERENEMKKRKLFLGMLIASAAFGMAACGNNKQKPSDDSGVKDPGTGTSEGGQKDSYTVTFETNGGSAVAPQIVEEGSKATNPGNPTKQSTAGESYSFVGWFTDASLSTPFDFNSEITAAITLYAKWESTPNQFVVTFDTNGGSEVAPQTINYNSNVEEPADPTKTATAAETYEFAGWYKDAGFNQAFDFANDKITSATTLYAKWDVTPVEYLVTFNSNGGTEVAQQSVAYGNSVSKPTDPTKAEVNNTKFAFAGWYKDEECTEVFDFTNDKITSAITLYAKWDQTDKITVIFESNGGSHVESILVYPGETISKPADPTKTATAAETYTFAGWYTDADFTQAFDFTAQITTATTIYAKWTATPIEYTVTFNTNGGTEIDSQTVLYGQKATQPTNPTKAATSTSKYEFAGWYSDAACTKAFDFATDTITSATTLYAKWNQTDKVTITFNTNGGTQIDSQSLFPGEYVVQPTDPTKAATAAETYAFAGWYSDAEFKSAFDFTAPVSGAATIYAKWDVTPVEFTVTFNTNGGTAIDSQTVAYGQKAVQPSNSTKAATVEYEYTFAGWYKDAEFKNAFDFATDTITSATTLYAKWNETAIEYTVTFEVNGGTTVDSQSVGYGQKINKPSNPTKEASVAATYSFVGWYKDAEFKNAFDFENDTITSATTLYAKWDETPVEYEVLFDVNGGSSVVSQMVAYGSKLNEPTAPTKESTAAETYTFAGWYTDSEFKNAFDFENDTITQSITLYAKWDAEAREYTVTFNPNGGTPLTTQKVKYGQKVETPVIPTKEADEEYSYEFMYWSTNEYYLVNFDLDTAITGDITVYACYIGHKISYQVTFNSNGGTSVDAQTVLYGDFAVKPTDPTKAEDDNYTYTFVGWYTDANLTNAFDFDSDTITGTTALYAKWAATAKVAPEPDKFMVTFESNGGTSVAVQQIADGGYVTEPTAPTKAATAAESYTFAGWYKDQACTEAFDFANDTITAATTLYAKWTATPVEYTITFESNGGSVVDSLTLPYGSQITRPANPTKEATATVEYTFAYWCTNPQLTMEFKFDKTVTESITLYARWIETSVEYTVTFDTNGGTAVASQTVGYGQKVTEPANPTKEATSAESYTFAGWYKDQACTEAFDFANDTITAATTIYAKWNVIPVEFTVTFDVDGGTAVASQTVGYGQKVTEPANPTKEATVYESYTFAGWYKDSGFTQAFDFANDTITSATTIYAKWTATPAEYLVYFNSNGGTAVETQEVAYGDTVIKPADPTKAATATETFAFDGWYTDTGFANLYDFSTEVHTTFTLYAKWNATTIQNEDQISIGFGEGLTPWTQLILEDGKTIPAAGTNTTLNTVSYNGFTFSSSKHRVDIGSTGAVSYNSQSSTISFTVGSTCTLYVEGAWASDTAGKVYLKQGSTAVYTSNSYVKNDDLSFNIELAAGTYTLSSDKSIRLSKLYRVVDLVTVTYSTDHGSVAATQIEKGGKLASLPELYAEGYVFGGWYSNAACTQAFSTDTAITTNTTLYAKWTEYNPDNYVTITFDTGLSSETIDPVVIDKNTKLTNVPELTLAGYRFDGWYTDANFATTFNPNANITSSITLYARFVQQFTVTFKYEDNTTISSVTLDKDDHIDNSDIPSPKFIYGYEFDNWYNGNTVFDFYNTAITSNLTLVAKYNVAAQTSTVSVIASGASFESLYAEFLQFEESTEYAAYVKLSSSSAYTKLDNQLIRKYRSDDNTYDYYRVDAVGLKAGTYTLKIVPIVSGSEATAAQTEVSNLVVEAHDRSGFGFVNGSSSGAYNDDGTLKSNAQVVYVTNSNKDTVTLAGAVGVQNIIIAMKAQKTISTPVAIRFLGNIEDPANMPNGDLYLDDVANLTVEGIGIDATMNGFGIVIKNSSNVEIRNVGFMNCNSKEGDDCGLQQANDHIWVHNCDFFYGDAGSDADQKKGDGALDTKKSTYVTHSYNHFWDCGKCNLQGMKDETTSNYITYHHNWYDHSDSRHPRIRTCTVHIYNNYFDGNAKYGVGVTMGASAFVESNYFRSTATMKPMLSSMQGTDALGDGTFSGETGGIIKAYNNTFDGNVSFISYQQNNTSFDAYVATSRNEQVPSTVKTVSGGTTYNNFDTASSMYSYTAQSPADAKATVIAKAGRVQGGDFMWPFNNSTEDSNYAVIDGLKTALTNYSSKLLSVQSIGEQSSGSGSGSGNTEPTGTTVADVISMIDALPAAANVTASDKTAINNAKAAFDGLSESDQAQVTNSSKLSECVAALNAILYSGSHIKTFDEGVQDSTGYFTITGNLKSNATAKTYDGVTYTTALKMESATTISFTCSGNVTLIIITDTASKKIKLDGGNKTTDTDGVYTESLSSGTYTITKGDSINVYAIIVKTN